MLSYIYQINYSRKDGVKFMRIFKSTIKIEASETNPNFYVIFRKNLLNSQEVAYAKVFPNHSYQLEVLAHLSYEETQYVRKYLLEKANMTGKSTKCFIENQLKIKADIKLYF